MARLLRVLSCLVWMTVTACGRSTTCGEGFERVGSSCEPIDGGLADGGGDADSDGGGDADSDGGADAAVGCEATCPDDGNECTVCDETCTRVSLTNVSCAEGDGLCQSGDCQPLYVLYEVGSGAGLQVYLVPVDGSQTARMLSPTLSADRRLTQWWISDDGTRFLYKADQDTRGVRELYALPIDGSGDAIKLSLPLAPGDSVGYSVQVQGDRIYYRTMSRDLYAVAIDGSGGRKLNTESVDSFSVTASGLVIYRSDDSPVGDLFLTNQTGTTPRRINPPLSSRRRIRGFTVNPDETGLCYRADQDTRGVVELYCVDFDSDIVTKVNAPLVAGGNVDSFALLGGGRVLYLADQNIDDINELFIADGTGSVIPLNAPLVAGGQVEEYRLPLATGQLTELVPDEVDYVVYLADQDTLGVPELYAARLDGSGVIKLNAPLPAGSEVQMLLPSFNSERVLYVADQDRPGVSEIYSVRPDGSERAKLNGRLVPGGSIRGALPTSDGQWLIYMADQDIREVVEAYAVRLDGSERVKLNGPLVAGGDVYEALFVNLRGYSTWALYLADEDVDEVTELYASRYDGTRRLKLSAPLRVGEQVQFAWQRPLPLPF